MPSAALPVTSVSTCARPTSLTRRTEFRSSPARAIARPASSANSIAPRMRSMSRPSRTRASPSTSSRSSKRPRWAVTVERSVGPTIRGIAAAQTLVICSLAIEFRLRMVLRSASGSFWRTFLVRVVSASSSVHCDRACRNGLTLCDIDEGKRGGGSGICHLGISGYHRRHRCSIREDGDLIGHLVKIGYLAPGKKTANVFEVSLTMGFRDRAYAIIERVFAYRVDERATLEVAARKPFAQQGEKSGDSLPGIMHGGRRQLGVEPFEPRIALALHDGADKSFFGSKLIVESPAGHAGLRNDPVDARGVNAGFIE